MPAVDVRSSALHVARVRVRGAADALRVRGRVEAALIDLAPSALGLTPRAVLIVRHVAPPRRLRVSTTSSKDDFASDVRTCLQDVARRAQRAWLNPDAARADAVLFADEAELVACLVRDWLRGAVAGHWWWRAVLGDIGVERWLRDNALGRGEVLVPALSLLTSCGDAVPWAARCSDADAERAAASIAHSYALRLAEAAPTAVAPRSATGGARARATPDAERGASVDRSVALHQLIVTVPELRAAVLGVPQRRLLALALVVSRAPAWARTPQLAAAMQMIGRVGPTRPEVAASAEPDVTVTVMHETPSHEHRDPLATAPRFADRKTLMVEAVSMLSGHDRLPTSECDPEAVQQPQGSREPPRKPSLPDSVDRAPSAEPWRPLPAIPIPSAGELPRPVDSARGPLTEGAAARMPFVPDTLRVRTEFGGVFYLLNAALALELYADFTTPRTQGLALSPWDLLALVGRAWFGTSFVRDPVWRVLAALAGRAGHDVPATAFDAPREWVLPDSWLIPWERPDVARVDATRLRLRVLHPVGFVLYDVARSATLPPSTQARMLCDTSPQLRGVRLVPASPPRGRASRRSHTSRWLHWLLDYLRARLALALRADASTDIPRIICAYPADIAITSTAVDVHLTLAELPLSIRIAGLDRNAGWIPAAGRSLNFHFT
jgi:hypothetical protein